MGATIGKITDYVNGNLTVSPYTASRSDYRPMDSLKVIVARIENRIAALNTNPTAVSKAARLSPGAIYNLQRGASGKIPLKGGSLKTYDAIAPVLKTTVAWLTKGKGPEEVESGQPPPQFRKRQRLAEVPLLDTITAGKLKSPLSQIPLEDKPVLTFENLGPGDFFALRVEPEADSMDRVSPPGSILVVNARDRILRNGKYYIFSLNGETTYKMWQDDDPPMLLPFSTNPMHKPIPIKRRRDLEVIGRVKRTALDL